MVKQIEARTNKTLQNRINKFIKILGELPKPVEKYTQTFLTLTLKDNTRRFYCRIDYDYGYEA